MPFELTVRTGNCNSRSVLLHTQPRWVKGHAATSWTQRWSCCLLCLGLAAAAQVHAIIVWLKVCSYAFTNRDLRHAYVNADPAEGKVKIYELAPMSCDA